MREEWRRAVLAKEVLACETRGPAPAAADRRWREGTWNVRAVLAARRTASCFGDWEYAVEWEGRWERDWVYAKQIQDTEAMRADMQEARERAEKRLDEATVRANELSNAVAEAESRVEKASRQTRDLQLEVEEAPFIMI